jgi:hypothetical protein
MQTTVVANQRESTWLLDFVYEESLEPIASATITKQQH